MKAEKTPSPSVTLGLARPLSRSWRLISPPGPGDGGGDPVVQDGVVGLEYLGEDDGLSVVGEAGDGVDRHSSLLSHHVKHRQLSLLVQLDLVTPHPGPGLARLTDDDKSRYLRCY